MTKLIVKLCKASCYLMLLIGTNSLLTTLDLAADFTGPVLPQCGPNGPAATNMLRGRDQLPSVDDPTQSTH
eukprot:symbB.v1.2.017427.t1/scaffold1359.1/size123592/12